MLKQFLPKLGLTITIFAVLLASWPLFKPGYFSHHDDLQVIRIFEMRKCFADGQIPCRWASDLANGFGLPIFSFYSVAPYFIGAIFSFLFGYVVSAKILFFIPILLGGLGMYFLIREIFDDKSAVFSSILYIFVPYHALDIYVRGAVSESFALGIVPVVMYFVVRLAKKFSTISFLGMTMGLVVIFTSHNISTLIFTPIIILWTIYWAYRSNFRTLKFLILSFVFSLAVSSFFIVPAFFEKNLVSTDNLTVGDLDYRNHFVSFRQLFFDRSWGYGASVLGSNDGISFQIGVIHWFLVLLMPLIMIAKKTKSKANSIGIFVIILFCFSVVMTHARSGVVWENIKLLKFVQFPWRFLGLTALITSIAGGWVLYNLELTKKTALLAVFCAAAVMLNFNYFVPEKFYLDINDKNKLSGQNLIDQKIGAMGDYLPKGAMLPKMPAPDVPLVVYGVGSIDGYSLKSNSWEFNIDANENSVVEIPQFYFSGWEVPGYKLAVSKNGSQLVSIPAGKHKVVGKFFDSGLRFYMDIVSLFGVIGFFAFLYVKNRRLV